MNIQKGLFKNFIRQSQSQMILAANMRTFIMQQKAAGYKN